MIGWSRTNCSECGEFIGVMYLEGIEYDRKCGQIRLYCKKCVEKTPQ